ncbi:hypothetical protein NECAME_17828 [Necator americanus]|uniref:Uncharacterized protein n=1 Tax=Necator americanus TaxID=51031 RepID=W2TJF8_NECAM|nr:hypothetical protein NECAME_17828 [Necator americanus]ETN81734.1 hypothetical protein NECAME_17828 [Necator americanus]
MALTVKPLEKVRKNIPVEAVTRPAPSELLKGASQSGGKNPSHCRRVDLAGELPVVFCLIFYRRDVLDGFEQPVVVKPGQPFQHGQF